MDTEAKSIPHQRPRRPQKKRGLTTPKARSKTRHSTFTKAGPVKISSLDGNSRIEPSYDRKAFHAIVDN